MKMYNNCKRCNRPLKSEESKRRGYGPYCYSKVNETTNSSNTIKIDKKEYEERVEIEGQISILKEVM